VTVLATPAVPSRSERGRGVLLGTGGLLLLALESPGIRLAQTGAWEANLGFGLFSALSMACWVRWRTGSSLWVVARRGGARMYGSALLQAVCTTLFIVALHFTSVANTVVIFATTPAFAAVLAHWALGETTSLRTWLGIVGALGGIAIVFAGSLGSGGLFGDLCAFGAVAAYAGNLTLMRRYPELNREAIIGLSGLLLALVSIWFVRAGQLELDGLLILAVLGLLTGPFGRVFVAAATRYLPVAQVSLLSPVETLAATGLAWWWLGEAPLPSALVGGAVVILALILGLSE
jgi:drug/metabolite transporter (DMT)-like permease